MAKIIYIMSYNCIESKKEKMLPSTLTPTNTMTYM